jgi:hypothetical protein
LFKSKNKIVGNQLANIQPFEGKNAGIQKPLNNVYKESQPKYAYQNRHPQIKC